MTQEQYNIIVKVLQNGAPALAEELINGINNLIKENAALKVESQKQENVEEKEKEE